MHLKDFYKTLRNGVPDTPKYTYFQIQFFGSSMPKTLMNQMCIFRGENDTQPSDLKTYFTNMLNVTNFVTDESKLEAARKKAGNSSSCNSYVIYIIQLPKKLYYCFLKINFIFNF